MIRWVIVIFVLLVCVNWFTPWLYKLGLGRLPGDWRFKWFGRECSIPLASTLLLSVLASLATRWFSAGA